MGNSSTMPQVNVKTALVIVKPVMIPQHVRSVMLGSSTKRLLVIINVLLASETVLLVKIIQLVIPAWMAGMLRTMFVWVITVLTELTGIRMKKLVQIVRKAA
jgi:hypothetical protein